MSDGQFFNTNPLFIKGTTSAVLAGVIDRFYFKEEDITHNAVVAASTSFGIVVGYAIGNTIPSVIEDTSFYNGKTIATRSMEIIVGSGVAYGAFYNSGYNWDDRMTERIGAVILTDFFSEYITDYMTGKALQYFV